MATHYEIKVDAPLEWHSCCIMPLMQASHSRCFIRLMQASRGAHRLHLVHEGEEKGQLSLARGVQPELRPEEAEETSHALLALMTTDSKKEGGRVDLVCQVLGELGSRMTRGRTPFCLATVPDSARGRS